MDITQEFKDALSTWASGVTVVSTRADGLFYGLTVSSFSSLSLDPPLVTVCLANANRMSSMIESAGQFTVSILARDQEDVSNHFASQGREPVSDLAGQAGDWEDGDLPRLTGAVANLECNMYELIIKGDHTIAVGEVRRALSNSDAWPLLYYRRAYRGVTGEQN